MFVIEEYSFDNMENEIGSAICHEPVVILMSNHQQDADAWIEEKNKTLKRYKGWDQKEYPYYTAKRVNVAFPPSPEKNEKVYGYHYGNYKEWLTTDEGKEKIEKVRSSIKKDGSEMTFYDIYNIGETWETLAVIDYLEEEGYIRNISKEGFTQNWRYVYNGQ